MGGFEMFFLYKLIGGLVTPPGCFFAILIPLSFSIMRRKGRASRKSGIVLFPIVLTLYALFMPVTAEFLMARVETERPVLPTDKIPTLVAVLAGGGTHPIPGDETEIELAEQSYQRLIEGLRAADALGCALLYSGGYDEGDRGAYERAIRKIADGANFKGELLLELTSRTTQENIEEISKVAEQRAVDRIVISTTAYHMKRALWTARRKIRNAEIIAWPSGWRSTRDKLTIGSFGPSARAFLDSCTALREFVGLFAYKILN
jgi:uncharacterized SAM-binding protein YcdF (DUF218 family)